MNETNPIGNITEGGKSAGNHASQKAQPPMPIFAKQKAIQAECREDSSLIIRSQDNDAAKPQALDQSGDLT